MERGLGLVELLKEKGFSVITVVSTELFGWVLAGWPICPRMIG